MGRPWERKFLGFRINPEGKIEVAPQSVERFRTKVRELWRSCQSRSSDELRDAWRAYVRGWWAYYGLAEDRRNIFGLEGWIRRHIRGMLLAAVAQLARAAAEATSLGTERTPA